MHERSGNHSHCCTDFFVKKRQKALESLEFAVFAVFPFVTLIGEPIITRFWPFEADLAGLPSMPPETFPPLGFRIWF